MNLTLVWEQEEVNLGIESDRMTPLDLCAALGPRGREMMLEILCINYDAEVEQMLKLTWTGHAIPRRAPSSGEGEPVKPPRRS